SSRAARRSPSRARLCRRANRLAKPRSLRVAWGVSPLFLLLSTPLPHGFTVRGGRAALPGGQNRREGPRNSGRRAPAGERLSGRGETGWLARTQGGREPQRGSMPVRSTDEDSRPPEDNARRPVSPRPAPQSGSQRRE